LRDALVEAEELFEQLPAAVSRRTLGERLGKALVDLRTSDRQVERMQNSLKIAGLIEFGSVHHRHEILTEMVDCAFSVGQSLEKAQDAEALRKAVYEYTTDLNQSISTLERSVREHWRTFATERFLPLLGLGDLLESMNVPNQLGQRLKLCGQKGQTSINAGSIKDLLSSIEQLLNEYDRLQEERKREIGEDEVGDFVNALADKRATLAMVTPKVREGLDERKALDRLGITAR
jgi:hypothetical protein